MRRRRLQLPQGQPVAKPLAPTSDKPEHRAEYDSAGGTAIAFVEILGSHGMAIRRSGDMQRRPQPCCRNWQWRPVEVEVHSPLTYRCANRYRGKGESAAASADISIIESPPVAEHHAIRAIDPARV
jgi:hypothetical protein